MVKIFTVDSPFAPGMPGVKTLTEQAIKWDSSQVIDYVLCGYSSLWPHNFITSSYLFSLTSKVKLIVAHRPGVMHPAAAARVFGTMDFLAGGERLAINFVTGSSPKDVHREGDYADKETRYERAADYVAMMKKAWSEPQSFDYEGPFYKAEGVRQLMKPIKGHVPVFMGGDSDEAVAFGAQHADTYMLWGEPLAGTQERIERVTKAAAAYGRRPEFSLSLRLFIADTDEQAWELARSAEDTILQAQGTNRFARSASTDQSVGKLRQMATADEEVHDDCFWTGLVKLLGGFANSAALVGTPERVLAAMKQYRALGVDAFLITGGVDGLWEPSLEEFLMRVKKEL